MLMNNMWNNKFTMWISTWLILTKMMIMIDSVMQRNMKTHKGGVSGNRTRGPNMARLMVNTLVFAQVVTNHLFSPCWKTCVLSNESATKMCLEDVVLLKLLKRSASKWFVNIWLSKTTIFPCMLWRNLMKCVKIWLSTMVPLKPT